MAAELWKWLDVSIRIAQSIVEDNRITAGGTWYTVRVTFSIMLHAAPGETHAVLLLYQRVSVLTKAGRVNVTQRLQFRSA